MAGLDTEETQAAVRMTVKLSPQAASALKKISEERGVTITEALRWAISMQNYVHEARKRGATVVVRESNGDVKELVFDM
ncbi:CopG family transcriptional regulator [Actinoplanes sp. CA-142083]|uniref:ribbon-helix-helix domain-containing protein n=1 Tax=Actinoplanes sp. CA-142083 TaxID=3239903 RepID=UPI003D936E2D